MNPADKLSVDVDVQTLSDMLDHITYCLTEMVVLTDTDMDQCNRSLQDLGDALVDTEVYFAPSPDMDVQGKTMEYFINMINAIQQEITVSRNLLLQFNFMYDANTVQEMKVLYLYAALFGYVLDCLRYLPYDRCVIHRDNAVSCITDRFVTVLQEAKDQKMPPIAQGAFNAIINRLVAIKKDYDLIVMDGGSLSMEVKDELMGIAWNPERYFQWCLSTQEQVEIASRWVVRACVSK